MDGQTDQSPINNTWTPKRVTRRQTGPSQQQAPSSCLTASCLWYLDDSWAGLLPVLWVFQDFDFAVADDAPSQEDLEETDRRLTLSSHLFTARHLRSHSYLADQSGLPSVCDVILSDVTVQPVTEVKIAVVQRDQDVCDQTWTDE